MKSKYGYIEYPFFGTYVVPDVQIEFDKISASVANRYNTLKLQNSDNYLEELLEVELDENHHRFKFHITAKSTQELVMLPRKCIWGVDIKGNIHNLTRKEEFPHLSLRPVKVTKGKYIWFKEITRPIEVLLSIKSIQDDLCEYWYSFLYIDNVWELHRITEGRREKSLICL